MLQPPQDADPQGHRFKVDNLAGMVRSYRAAGAQVLVISGVIDPEHGHDFAQAAPDADFTFCHLTVDEPTLRTRLAARGWPSEAADEAVIMMRGLAEGATGGDGLSRGGEDVLVEVQRTFHVGSLRTHYFAAGRGRDRAYVRAP